MKPVEKVLDQLDEVRKNGSGWKARCPAHDDANPSLSIKEGDDGRVLVKCFAGCPTQEIVNAAGLRMADLFERNGRQDGHDNGRPRPRRWPLKDADGKLVAVHYRKDTPDGKRVWWRGPNGEKKLKDAGLRATDLPLYRSELAAEWPEDAPVVLVEGEPAADALAAVHPTTLGTVTGAESAPGTGALEVLRGRRVILWPDSDGPGQKHMGRVAEGLRGVASEVRIFAWRDAPEDVKGPDAADHPAVVEGEPETVARLLDELAAAPVWEPDEALSMPREADPGGLAFRTAKEAAALSPDKTEWIVPPFIARGAITELDGKIKAGGKTTLLSHMVKSVVNGSPFMGEPTRRTKVLLLTEQSPTSFRKVLERAGLTDCEDLLVLFWHDVAGLAWPEVAALATEKALEVGADLLITDTLGQFAGIRGDDENSAGAAQEAMGPLQKAAARGLGVLLTRHERKGGGAVGESARGSSAFGGAVDVILSIRRGDGNTRPTVRLIESLSRFEETPDKLVVELTDNGYRALGDAGAFAEKEAMGAIVDVLPTKADDAMPSAAIVDALKEQDMKRTTIQSALVKLVEAGTAQRVGEGRKGDPYRHYKTTPDGTDEGDIRSADLSVEVAAERKTEAERPNGEMLSAETPRGSGRTNTEEDQDGFESPVSEEEMLSAETSTYIRPKETAAPTAGALVVAETAEDHRNHPEDCLCGKCLPL